ncbi:hypothetical protein lerEdw1_016734 [Lerista edwardsae]|nr:hypothetical protein lerEdw1_016734 [Lerista edwardsae]
MALAFTREFHLVLRFGFCILTAAEQCALQPRARVNCGYPAISAQECHNRGCCYDSSIIGVIWCFFPASSECNP